MWESSRRKRTKKLQGRADNANAVVRQRGIGVLALLTLFLIAVWLLLRRRAREAALLSPLSPGEEGAERVMTDLPSSFKSHKGEEEYMAAYEAALRLWPVAYEPMDIPGRYGRTHLVATGPKDAPTLVLLHMYFANLTMWAANIADLSRDYRVYAIDVIGQPNKSLPNQPLKSREDYVAWLSELLGALNIESTNLIGASFGGWLSLNYALGAPERVNKIALLSPAGGFVPLVKQFYLRGLPMGFFTRRFLVDWFIRWTTYEENLRDSNTRLIYLGCMADQMYLGFKHFRVQAGTGPDVFSDEELRSMQIPTLLLIGQQEVLYEPEAALERARRLIPNFEGGLVPQASHDMTISQHEIVDRRVLAFLKASSLHPQSS